MKACADPDCRAAFFDTSRNHTSRWCTRRCGNRNNARALRRRGGPRSIEQLREEYEKELQWREDRYCNGAGARINEFLHYSRPVQPELETVDLHKVGKDLAKLIEPDLEGCKECLKVEGDTACVHADPGSPKSDRNPTHHVSVGLLPLLSA